MNRALSQVVGGFLVLIVSVATTPLVAQQPAAQTQQAPPAAQPSPPADQTLPPIELPENPGRNTSQPGTGNTQNAPFNQNSTPQQTPSPQPSGTAVAPPVQVSGGAASKPAGVAIAPPKQRQIRSLLIKLGLIAGAGVAVGTVVGLSAASPGHVPNSPGH